MPIDVLAVLRAAANHPRPGDERSALGSPAIFGTGHFAGSANVNPSSPDPVKPVIPEQINTPTQGVASVSKPTAGARELGKSITGVEPTRLTGTTGLSGKHPPVSRVRPFEWPEWHTDVMGCTGSRAEYLSLIGRLDPLQPPADVQLYKWPIFVADAERLAEENWLDHAFRLGWTINDLVGADLIRPAARLEKAGLVWFLNRRRLIAMTMEAAAIDTGSNGRLVYRRRVWGNGAGLAAFAN